MNTEDAYKIIVREAIEKAGNLAWDSLVIEIEIFDRMCSSVHWVLSLGEKIQGNGVPSLQIEYDAMKACLFLRDNILQTTGQRIWGLTFTYFNDGNFNIDYKYDKPDTYQGK